MGRGNRGEGGGLGGGGKSSSGIVSINSTNTTTSKQKTITTSKPLIQSLTYHHVRPPSQFEASPLPDTSVKYDNLKKICPLSFTKLKKPGTNTQTLKSNFFLLKFFTIPHDFATTCTAMPRLRQLRVSVTAGGGEEGLYRPVSQQGTTLQPPVCSQ